MGVASASVPRALAILVGGEGRVSPPLGRGHELRRLTSSCPGRRPDHGALRDGAVDRTSWLDVPLALVIPVAWVVWMLVRGAVIEAYPYGFINVINLGYATALRNIVGMLLAGAVVMVVFKGADALLGRLHREEAGAASVG